ncbi:MAG: peptidylprolyl isomerase [Myxococcales bacterium]|nr:peptidylprolyl isomerase [Myxococcales bacterium]
MRSKRHILAIGLSLHAFGLASCAETKAPGDKTEAYKRETKEKARALEDGCKVDYPPGPWRLAPASDLRRTMIWVSSILISHKDAEVDLQGGLSDSWLDSVDRVQRTRQEASKLAHELCSQLRASPGAFPSLAREYSDHRLSFRQGGSLGGTRANTLGSKLLDGLQAEGPGQITGVIESGRGFHLLVQRPPPDPGMVAGRRLVIRYDAFLRNLFAGAPNRTRAEASNLAHRLFSSKLPFVELVRAHSESADRMRDGDIGVWSVRHPEDRGRMLDRLSKLAVGEISEPLETWQGLEILQRTEVTERARFAARTLRVPFRIGAGDAARKRALKRATRLALKLSSAGTALRAEEIARGERGVELTPIDAWTEGRAHPQLEARVKALDVGAFAKRPLLLGTAYVIAQRLDPDRAPPEESALYELPAPRAVDVEVDDLLELNSGAVLAERVRLMRTDLRSELSLDAQQHEVVAKALDGLANAFEQAQSGPEKVGARQRMQRSLELRLPPEVLSRTRAFMARWVAREVMKQPQ